MNKYNDIVSRLSPRIAYFLPLVLIALGAHGVACGHLFWGVLTILVSGLDVVNTLIDRLTVIRVEHIDLGPGEDPEPDEEDLAYDPTRKSEVSSDKLSVN